MAQVPRWGDFSGMREQTHLPVLVDFWAEWCDQCRMTNQMLEEIAADFGDKVCVVKANVDEQPSLRCK